MGQGALILAHPQTVANPFFFLVIEKQGREGRKEPGPVQHDHRRVAGLAARHAQKMSDSAPYTRRGDGPIGWSPVKISWIV
jgi:hypothetical protein